MGKKDIALSLVLPVLNEADIILGVVSDIESVLKRINIVYELVLVENESEDGTWEVLEEMASLNRNLVLVRAKRGYGSAIIAGIRQARGAYIGYMPSDGQIDPEILMSLWSCLQSGVYDVVKIRRINRETVMRAFRSKIYNSLSRLLFSIPVSDINGSPRILSRKTLQHLHLAYPDSFIDTEFAVKAGKAGLRIIEIPMVNRKRSGGSSTVRVWTVIEFLRNLLVYRIREFKNN